MPPETGDLWRVRVLGPSRAPFGAGVLLSSGRVLTCAHVVAEALGLAAGEDPGGRELFVDFPGSLRGAGPVAAAVLPGCWVPPREERGDVAVLRLRGEPPGDCPPASLSPSGATRGRTVWAYGHPAGLPAGVWLRAELSGPGGPSPDWVQFAVRDTADGPPLFGRGFSGAGLVDGAGRVLGIVVAAHGRGRGTGWMLPVAAAARYCPGLAAEPPAPAAPDSVATERLLTEALLRLPSVADAQRRDRVLRDTGADIAGNTERSPVPREDVRAIVATALRYADGLDRLVAAVRWYEDGSLPMAELEALLVRLRAGQSGYGESGYGESGFGETGGER